MQTGADRCGLVCFLGVFFWLADIWRPGADRCGQVWFLGVFLSRWTFGGRLRTAVDSYGQVWFLGFLNWRTFCGQVRTGVDKTCFWVSLSWLTSGGHLADRCGQLDIWRTLASLLDQYPEIVCVVRGRRRVVRYNYHLVQHPAGKAKGCI